MTSGTPEGLQREYEVPPADPHHPDLRQGRRDDPADTSLPSHPQDEGPQEGAVP
jgi:hypothetical protein